METIDTTAGSLGFEIRLNSTYEALYNTDETIAVKVAIKLRETLDSLIVQHEEEGAVIERYKPEKHLRHLSHFNEYRSNLPPDETISVKKILWPNYALRVHHIENDEYEFMIANKLEDLYPDKNYNINDAPFDILDYTKSDYELRYNDNEINDKENFALFFAIRVGTEAYGELDDFLRFHLTHNFANDSIKYNKFLSRVCAEFEAQAINKVRCDLMREWAQQNTKNSANVKEANNSAAVPIDGKKKTGRRPTEKIEISKPLTRSNGDNMTIWTRQEVSAFFSFLCQNKLILSKENLTKENLAKAIYVITGYSFHNIRHELDRSNEENDYLATAVKKIQEAIRLRDKRLGKK